MSAENREHSILKDSNIHAKHALHHAPPPALMSASTITGDNVYNNENEDLGKIKDIVLDLSNGRISYAVLSSGTFLGLGEKLFAVPWSALTLDAENKCFVLNVDKDEFKLDPGFDKDKWPDMADKKWELNSHNYYKATPYDEGSHTGKADGNFVFYKSR
ncbi:PRC-barrel domain containing protein [Aestuariicella hydrocarbonica]|uniref:PRC-barrel domain containing protein n=1 Tax=Pseudomaricurvus hydrocarbonicus TaxID=1470433 RepID=A0A9E5JRZ1_9GAMM|nr:PRC-barrel domain-containing protein [Aestuariicella hydrocarbonica]NHO65712.1 PRC-barrel domain containing protein [Aestuariicella hydrocarbonica]